MLCFVLSKPDKFTKFNDITQLIIERKESRYFNGEIRHFVMARSILTGNISELC